MHFAGIGSEVGTSDPVMRADLRATEAREEAFGLNA
jgi:hypothetical protein